MIIPQKLDGLAPNCTQGHKYRNAAVTTEVFGTHQALNASSEVMQMRNVSLLVSLYTMEPCMYQAIFHCNFAAVIITSCTPFYFYFPAYLGSVEGIDYIKPSILAILMLIYMFVIPGFFIMFTNNGIERNKIHFKVEKLLLLPLK